MSALLEAFEENIKDRCTIYNRSFLYVFIIEIYVHFYSWKSYCITKLEEVGFQCFNEIIGTPRK